MLPRTAWSVRLRSPIPTCLWRRCQLKTDCALRSRRGPKEAARRSDRGEGDHHADLADLADLADFTGGSTKCAPSVMMVQVHPRGLTLGPRQSLFGNLEHRRERVECKITVGLPPAATPVCTFALDTGSCTVLIASTSTYAEVSAPGRLDQLDTMNGSGSDPLGPSPSRSLTDGSSHPHAHPLDPLAPLTPPIPTGRSARRSSRASCGPTRQPPRSATAPSRRPRGSRASSSSP